MNCPARFECFFGGAVADVRKELHPGEAMRLYSCATLARAPIALGEQGCIIRDGVDDLEVSLEGLQYFVFSVNPRLLVLRKLARSSGPSILSPSTPAGRV